MSVVVTMINNKRVMPFDRQGFTLIELLVVVSIIGLLASIVVVSLGGSRVQSRDTKRLADIRQIQQAMELCYNDVGCAGAGNDYPANVGPGCPASIGSYMAQVPVDPLNSGTNVYACRSNITTYCLSALMEGSANYTHMSPAGTLTGQAGACAAL